MTTKMRYQLTSLSDNSNCHKIRTAIDEILKDVLGEETGSAVVKKLHSAKCLYEAMADYDIAHALENSYIVMEISKLTGETPTGFEMTERLKSAVIMSQYYGTIDDERASNTKAESLGYNEPMTLGEFVKMVYLTFCLAENLIDNKRINELYMANAEEIHGLAEQNPYLPYYYAMERHVVRDVYNKELIKYINMGIDRFSAIYILMHTLYPNDIGRVPVSEYEDVGIGLNKASEIYEHRPRFERYEYFAKIPIGGVDIDTYSRLQLAKKRGILKLPIEQVPCNIWGRLTRLEAVEMVVSLIDYDLENNIG
ncbi:MAG TPA: hypothetical protein DCP90_08465 [Clostridiales bacterium]|nr:MAG: hypothetical protein A2Y22_08295 [Clostridiales bacterium GWD2_32_59]HAN10626.1 hypothetical protein [Clostridiales bacterium]